MNTINIENCKTLLIGRRGENEVTTVAFDFTEWASEFGSGVVDLYVKRFGDESAYPVLLTIDGTVASWLVTETDTNVAGYGKAEYVYRVDGKIAKSAVFPFFVAEDIGQPASEPPDPYESWLEQLTALGAETEAHAQAAEQSAENAAESAEDAAGSAASAEGYAGQAETAAGLAQAAQTASEAARDAAQTAQASAEASATAASGSAASAAGSASDASASASAAGASASAASASATTASNAATAAQTAQIAAEDAAEDAQEAAQQAHVEYEQLSGEVDDLSDEVSQQKSIFEAHEQYAEETYAKQDGSYEDLTAGNAYELLSDRGDTNQQPYLFRQTGGDSSAYNREQLRKIVGGTVAWNQLVQNGNFTNSNYWEPANSTGFSVSDGVASFTPTARYGNIHQFLTGKPIKANHVVVFIASMRADEALSDCQLTIGDNVNFTRAKTVTLDANWKTVSLVIKETVVAVSNNHSLAIRTTLTAGFAKMYVKNVIGFDLTRMFGTAIADYIYSLEQATAGAGVAFFRSLFPDDYYDYNPGELMSVEGVSAHETVGFNQWDEEWEVGGINPSTGGNWNTNTRIRSKNYIPIKPSTEIYISYPTSGVSVDYCFYDANKSLVSSGNSANRAITTPQNAYYIRFATYAQYGTTYNHDICINVSDPKRNGTYEPYKKRTYPLDSSLTLRGIPRLDSNNRLYYDGDEYEPDGTATRRLHEDEVTSCILVATASTGKQYASASIAALAVNEAQSNNFLSDLYQFRVSAPSDDGKWFRINGESVYIFDPRFTDKATADSILAAEKPHFVYAVATPTAETAEPYRELQICDRDGTEEFVSTSIVPVGHETFYPVNVFDYIDQKIAALAAQIVNS